MKCPDCGTRFSEVFINGMLVHRCFKCGGFWADSKMVNTLPEEILKTWRRIKIDPMWLSGGKGMCPQDGTMLQQYLGDEIPNYLGVKRCIRCGKWWYPGDSLFEYATIKGGHQAMYGPMGDMSRFSGMVLPVVIGLVLLSGLAASLRLTQDRQQIQVPAYVESTGFEVEYVGDGKAVVILGDTSLMVEYRIVGSQDWMMDDDGVLEGLIENQNYEVRVGDKTLEFEAV